MGGLAMTLLVLAQGEAKHESHARGSSCQILKANCGIIVADNSHMWLNWP